MRVRIASTTRPSMPSYRPQANTSRSSAAYRAAASWVKSTPLGVGTTSRAAPSGMISSSASPQTSGFIAIPGPPPQVVNAELEVAARRRLADQRGAERPGEVLGEDRDDIDAKSHALTLFSGSPRPRPLLSSFFSLSRTRGGLRASHAKTVAGRRGGPTAPVIPRPRPDRAGRAAGR